MKAQIVDVFVTPNSLDTLRGVLVDGMLILPDPLCPGEVTVRAKMHLATYVSLVTVAEMELKESPLEDAFRNQVYNSGWFKGFFLDIMKDAQDLKSSGM